MREFASKYTNFYSFVQGIVDNSVDVLLMYCGRTE